MSNNVIEEAFASLNRTDRETINEGIFGKKDKNEKESSFKTDVNGNFTVIFIGYDGPKYISEAGVVGSSFKNIIRFKTAAEAEKFASNNGKDAGWKDKYLVVDLSKKDKENESVEDNVKADKEISKKEFSKEDKKEACPDCGKEVCECDKQPVKESMYDKLIAAICETCETTPEEAPAAEAVNESKKPNIYTKLLECLKTK